MSMCFAVISNAVFVSLISQLCKWTECRDFIIMHTSTFVAFVVGWLSSVHGEKGWILSTCGWCHGRQLQEFGCRTNLALCLSSCLQSQVSKELCQNFTLHPKVCICSWGGHMWPISQSLQTSIYQLDGKADAEATICESCTKDQTTATSQTVCWCCGTRRIYVSRKMFSPKTQEWRKSKQKKTSDFVFYWVFLVYVHDLMTPFLAYDFWWWMMFSGCMLWT